MYNPHILKTIKMVETIHNAHVGEIEQTRLTWQAFKDEEGNVLQIVPILTVDFKG